MALELSKATTQKADGTEVYVEVEDATGLYDAVDNPGGFGAPNLARNEVALIFYGVLKKSDGDVEIMPETNDPLTVHTFTILMEAALNGHHEYYVFALEIFDSLGVYVDGDIVYDNEAPANPFIKERVAGDWVEITAADLVGKTVVNHRFDELFIPQAQEFVNELNAAQLAKLRAYVLKNCGKDDFQDLRDRYDYAVGILGAATDDFAADAFAEAQLKVEALFAFEELLEDL